MKMGNAFLALRARTLAACGVLVLALGGCAVEMMENVHVSLHPYQPEGAARAGAAASRAAVAIEPVRDARRETVGSMIGERTTIGAVSMGSIEMEPVPTAVMAQVLKAELKGMGFTIVDSGELRVGAQLTKFQVTTPATPIYWDMNGVVELDVTATGPGGRKHVAQYAAKCTDRTYVFPSQELITNVVSACVREIGAKIRGDAALVRFLASG